MIKHYRRFLTNPSYLLRCHLSFPLHGTTFSALFAIPPPACSVATCLFRLMVRHFRPFLPYPPGKNGRAMTFSAFFAIPPWKKWQGYDTFGLFCHTPPGKNGRAMTLSAFFAIPPWKKWQGYDTFGLFCHTPLEKMAGL